MLRQYISTIFRGFVRNKTNTIVNLFGLAFGLSCFTLIVLYVEHEFRYDRFHGNPESIVRVVKDFVNKDGSIVPDATTPPALTPALRKDLPEVQHVTRLFPNWGRRYLLAYGDKRFYELNVIRIDSTFFDVFDFEFAAGDRNKPFEGLHTMLLTETAAKKYFGTENPIGKVLRVNLNNGTDYTVTGILKDVPHNSHFTFDVLIPFESTRNPDTNWEWYSFYTYVKLRPGTDATAFESNVKSLVKKYQPESTDIFHIQKLTDIHLRSSLKWELSENGDITYVNIFLIIATAVIVIAGLNYINLSTAQATRRAREVGIRKVTGAFRRTLILQFMLESLFIVLIAFSLSIIITTLVLPLTVPVVGYDLATVLPGSSALKTILPACVVATAVLAGIYPAIYLASFQPVKVLRTRSAGTTGGFTLRRSLVVFQFVISTILIMGVLIISNQLEYISKKNLGFNKENIILLPNIRGGVGEQGAPGSITESLKTVPGVSNVARADGILGETNTINGLSTANGENHITFNFIRVDYDYLPTMQIGLKAGRNFSPEFASDSQGIIINERAALQLGLTEPYVGQKLRWDDNPSESHEVTVIGVAEDFHFTSLREEIKPFGFILEVNNGSVFMVKVASHDLATVMKDIEKTWNLYNPGKPFDYSFQDEKTSKLFASEARFQKLFSWFTILAIVISCLGLFGLVTMMAEARTKEIGIRKVLGSSVSGIVTMLSKEFLKLVVVALALGTPLAYYAGNSWLGNFAYRTTIGWSVFFVAAVITLTIALLTVIVKSVRAATLNPVDSLRNE